MIWSPRDLSHTHPPPRPRTVVLPSGGLRTPRGCVLPELLTQSTNEHHTAISALCHSVLKCLLHSSRELGHAGGSVGSVPLETFSGTTQNVPSRRLQSYREGHVYPPTLILGWYCLYLSYAPPGRFLQIAHHEIFHSIRSLHKHCICREAFLACSCYTASPWHVSLLLALFIPVAPNALQQSYLGYHFLPLIRIETPQGQSCLSVCSTLYLWLPEKCLACSRHSIKIYWMNQTNFIACNSLPLYHLSFPERQRNTVGIIVNVWQRKIHNWN